MRYLFQPEVHLMLSLTGFEMDESKERRDLWN